ncbi:MAG: hypothetical protein ABIH42_04700 [Planctomycetota bacterium]
MTITKPKPSASGTADFIYNQSEAVYNLLQKSNALGLEEVFQQLYEVFDECSIRGWDGEDAEPISAETLQNAREILESFPLGIEPPEVGAEPDGAITLEWYKSPDRVISISINPDSRLYFAAIIGATRRQGSNYALSLSDDICKLISQVTGKLK